MKLIFATNNQNKIKEIQAVMPQGINVITLQQAGITLDIPEPFPTLEENARQKARTIYQMTNTATFGEDTFK
jgi:XTP/dITP diphosphohydrolase